MSSFPKQTAFSGHARAGILLAFAILWHPLAGAAPTAAERAVVRFPELRAAFRDPSMLYAPFAFWFWDEPLDGDKMEAMAARMVEQGFNPGYAHPRTTAPGVPRQNPLPTDEWLSAPWFEAFGRALAAATEGKAYLGYCDEYMWPSFQAAGRIATEHPELRSQSLHWVTHDLAPGEGITVNASAFVVAARRAEPPPPDPGPLTPPLGAWIWAETPGQGRHTCNLRQSFHLAADDTVVSAAVRLSVDNRYRLLMNGHEIGAEDDWRTVRTWDVTGLLQPGENVIAVAGGGDGGMDAMTCGLVVELAGGERVRVLSDASWRCRDGVQPDASWTVPGFDASAWDPVRVVASDPAAPPWSLSLSGPHRSTTVLSDTLRILSRDGEPVSWTAPGDGWYRVYVFRTVEHGIVNYLDERLAPTFIDIAHVPYAERFGAELGAGIPGVFVDNEGDYGPRLAWSATLDRRYREKWGRDIRLWMPLMLDQDVQGQYARARWEWFDVVTDLYAETMGSVSAWLAERGAYCISNLWEESLQWQAQYVGDFFKLTRAYTMPGNDCLGRKALEVHDFKETASVCEFEGRRFMSEIMGAGGWGPFTPAFMKQAVNAVVAWGVSHIVPHGVFTNRDLEGNVWTPDWYDCNPLFPLYHRWTDFARRASYVNAHGIQVADVLVLNPMDTVWATAPSAVFDPGTAGDLFHTDQWFGPRVAEINRVYSAIIDDLTAARVEFLVTDRHYLRGMDVVNGRLVHGDLAFRTLVLPPVDVLPLDVAERVLGFARAGGAVVAVGELPTGSVEHGLPDPRMLELMDRLRADPQFRDAGEDGFRKALEASDPVFPRHVQFESGEFVMLQRHVRIDDRDFYWLVNNSDHWRSCRLRFTGQGDAAASKWDCESGRVRPLACEARDGDALVPLVFRPNEAFWVVFDAEAAPLPGGLRALPDAEEPSVELVRLDGTWHSRIDPAVQPAVQFPVAVPDEFGAWTPRPLEPWSEWGLSRFSGCVDYLCWFDLETAPEGACHLDLGRVCHGAEVWLNGRALGARLWGPYVLDATGRLRAGRNELMVRVGNLVNNSYGDLRSSGLLGPVRVCSGVPGPPAPAAAWTVPEGVRVSLSNATADHSQAGFPVSAILEDLEEGWGGYQQYLREPIAATAVVETVTDLHAGSDGLELVFRLHHRQDTPAGLNLGRFRVSWTGDDRDAFADGLEHDGDVDADWEVLTPLRTASRNLAWMDVLADGSVFVHDAGGECDVYTLLCRVPAGSVVTGFRIEAMEDDRLPRTPGGQTPGGPGHSPNEGNFVLSYLEVEAVVPGIPGT